jgi:YCII-related domain
VPQRTHALIERAPRSWIARLARHRRILGDLSVAVLSEGCRTCSLGRGAYPGSGSETTCLARKTEFAHPTGTITAGTYPQTKEFNGGFTVLDVPSREAALEWAAKIAAACRCAQEIREFMPDPAVGN